MFSSGFIFLSFVPFCPILAPTHDDPEVCGRAFDRTLGPFLRELTLS